MLPTQVDLEASRGDSIVKTIYVTDEDGAVIDITNWKFFFTVKASNDDDDADALISYDWDTHTDADGGITTMCVPAADTDELAGVYSYDLQAMRASDGAIFTIISGNITFYKDTTRRIA